MKKVLLGIDIGTSGCKVAAFDLDGKVLCSKTKEYAVYYPEDKYAEQDADEWFSAVSAATKEMFLEGVVSPDEISGIGVDGQSWSAIPIDDHGETLRKTPIWFDLRAKKICERVIAEIGEKEIFDVCGNPFSPSYTTPKVMWYKEKEPELYSKIKYILQSNSFIVYKLTGEITQDVCQSFGLHFYNIKENKYDEAFCKKLGLDIEMFPKNILNCHEIAGYVNEYASKLTGLRVGTPVVAGGLDAACGTLGVGVIHAGETQEQGGQAGGMSICEDEYVAHEKLIMSRHVIPDKFLLQGGTVGGGGTVNWFMREFAGCYSEFDKPMRAFDDEAEFISAGSDGLVFLPYMLGERSPIWDPNAKGVYYGLDYSKTRAHLARATLEGVAFSVRHNLETAKEAGAYVERLFSMGGSANSALWMQIKADVTKLPISVPSADTATTLGACILAGVGVGAYSSFEEGVERTVRIKKKYEPNEDNYKVYDKNYKKYRQIYESLKCVMEEN